MGVPSGLPLAPTSRGTMRLLSRETGKTVDTWVDFENRVTIVRVDGVPVLRVTAEMQMEMDEWELSEMISQAVLSPATAPWKSETFTAAGTSPALTKPEVQFAEQPSKRARPSFHEDV